MGRGGGGREEDSVEGSENSDRRGRKEEGKEEQCVKRE